MTGQVFSYFMLVANVVWVWGWIQRRRDHNKWVKDNKDNES